MPDRDATDEQREPCPDCRIGHLAEIVYSERIRYRGHPLLVEGLKFWLCAVCDVEIIRTNQVREGDELIADARRRFDRLLPKEPPAPDF